MITDPCSWLEDKPIPLEGAPDQRMMKPGCKQTESWGRWWFEQFTFCPFCGHPVKDGR